MKGNFIYKRLGERIYLQRKKRNLTQEQLSLISDVDRSYIGKVERGKANPSFKTLLKLARGLRVKLSKLLEGV